MMLRVGREESRIEQKEHKAAKTQTIKMAVSSRQMLEHTNSRRSGARSQRKWLVSFHLQKDK